VSLRPALAILVRLSLKKKMTRGIAQVVEHLFCKYKALSSNPSLTYIYIYISTDICIIAHTHLRRKDHHKRQKRSFIILQPRVKYSPGAKDLLMLVILVTWEAEMGRVTVQGQPRQTV
jgi:hypothetical protein